MIARFDLLGGMMGEFSWMFLSLLTVSLWAAGGERAGNHTPLVTNVVAKQIDQRVEITYDLDDVDGDLMKVKLLASSDGGKHFDLQVKSVDGEIGAGVASGKSKRIVWHIGQDIPGFYGTNVVIEVVADDGIGPIIWEKDGAEMVLIPAGSFEMGDNEGKPNEQPVHIVKLDAFYIDIHEVTVGRYTKFLAETRYRQPNWNEIHKYSPTDDHPVIHVSWYDAMAYCEWVGKRLPTEAEWEYSARGGLVGKKYSWGNSAPTPDKANYWNDGSDDGTTIVGSYPANGYGLYDAVGNVYEWCLDAYDADYYSKSPKKNPLSSLNGTVDELTKKYKNVGNAGRVFRGGPWTLNSSTPFHLRVADRGYIYSPEQTNFGLGFRCVADVPPPEPEKD